MSISVGMSIAIIAICAITTVLSRAIPFLIFARREPPAVVRYLANLLPLAVMTTLVVYCLRGVTFSAFVDWVPALAASALTVILHLWRRNTLLSIVGGTACYMLLVQLVF